MLAMEVNDDAGSLTPHSVLRFFASSSLLQVLSVNAAGDQPRSLPRNMLSSTSSRRTQP
jgi:hypothetical protein